MVTVVDIVSTFSNGDAGPGMRHSLSPSNVFQILSLLWVMRGILRMNSRAAMFLSCEKPQILKGPITLLHHPEDNNEEGRASTRVLRLLRLLRVVRLGKLTRFASFLRDQFESDSWFSLLITRIDGFWEL